MSDMKSIRFPPPVADAMVRAILDGSKAVMRRAVRPPALYAIIEDSKGNCVCSYYEDERGGYEYPTVDDCPYQPGDILYVRETWNGIRFGNRTKVPFRTEYWYRADDTSQNPDDKWRPSIHMPKEAARLFLRVTDVRVERLQDITELQILEDEGVQVDFPQPKPSYMSLAYAETRLKPAVKEAFSKLWDSTIKKPDLPRYGWAENPWVWVIGFERISREDAIRKMKE